MSVAERELVIVPPQKRSFVRTRLLKTPVLESLIMIVVLVASYAAMGLIATGIETPAEGMSAGVIVGILFGCFVLSFAIALIAVVSIVSDDLQISAAGHCRPHVAIGHGHGLIERTVVGIDALHAEARRRIGRTTQRPGHAQAF